jgi:hypothetical protein
LAALLVLYNVSEFVPGKKNAANLTQLLPSEIKMANFVNLDLFWGPYKRVFLGLSQVIYCIIIQYSIIYSTAQTS